MPDTPSPIRFADLPMDRSAYGEKQDYEKELARLQETVLHVQQAYWHGGLRAVIVLEGWDAAGKGGAIRRLTEKLDPRGAHVWPIGAPSADEQGRHYLYRFWQRIPSPGTFAIFDRSWYGRVLVERVEGFASREAWTRAYREINEFERMLTDDGVRIVKLFLHITKEEQLKRFEERLKNPYKRWKLTEEDLRNRERWDDYIRAAEEMFDRTSTPDAPWTLIPANYKWHARTAVLRAVVDRLGEGVDVTPPPLDASVQKAAADMLGIKL
ncbi:polyphosphate kinase 2 family protein [Indioceanicola profundi]|uniref:polyphosphate kinase 2 family protein n=1 Tax=Indioceanicola profundi TaxID=2220096 RepID=UPI000E6ADFF2|nr:polyphosphate kinase [Indioceanicola profundi]